MLYPAVKEVLLNWTGWMAEYLRLAYACGICGAVLAQPDICDSYNPSVASILVLLVLKWRRIAVI